MTTGQFFPKRAQRSHTQNVRSGTRNDQGTRSARNMRGVMNATDTQDFQDFRRARDSQSKQNTQNFRLSRDARSTQGKRNAQGVVRVLAGSLKGQNLITPGNGQTHPMGAREKLALFNMLQPYLAAAKVLDAYAGSGALGIEALSRGAQEAVFVESSTRAAAIIKQNLQATKVALTTDSDRAAQVYCETTQKFCRRPAFHHYFSLILADPPYDNYHPEEIQLLTELLADEGILAVSFPKGTPTEFAGLELISYHSYAAAGIALYRRVTYA